MSLGMSSICDVQTESAISMTAQAMQFLKPWLTRWVQQQGNEDDEDGS